MKISIISNKQSHTRGNQRHLLQCSCRPGNQRAHAATAACASGGGAHASATEQHQLSASTVSQVRPPQAVAARPTGGARSQQGLSARQRPRQGWPPRPVAAGPTWPAPFRRAATHCGESVRLGWPPPAVAAGPAASWRGGRCHVSPTAPAATAEGVLFVKLIQR